MLDVASKNSTKSLALDPHTDVVVFLEIGRVIAFAALIKSKVVSICVRCSDCYK